jgi:hypothetical protein
MNRSRTHRKLLALVGVAATWASATVLALEPLQIEHQGEVTFVTGGVGDREQDAVREQAPNYDLEVTLASAETGAYLAGVQLTVRDATNQVVLDTVSRGPVLLANLPRGTYELSASSEGWSTERRRLEIGTEREVVHVAMQPESSD